MRLAAEPAGIAEVVPLRVVAYKVHAGGRLRIAQHPSSGDILALPQSHEAVAPAVGPKPSQIAHTRTCTSGRNGGVAGVSAKALQIKRWRVGRLRLHLVELDHGFTECHDVEILRAVGHGHSRVQV
jgi:hypothetical protein